MSKLTETEEYRGVPFTRREAEDATQAFIRTGVDLRHRLLELYERQAHTALGFATFEEYATERLGVTWDNRYLNQLRSWARVERDVHLPPVHAQPGGSLSVEIAKRPLSKHVAEELFKLPADQRRAAYQEALDLGASGRAELACVKHIVTRRLNESRGITPEVLPPAPAPAPAAPAPAAPAPARTEPARPEPPVSPVASVASVARSASAPAPEPEVPAQEDLPWKQWEEAACSTLTWIENQKIDGSAAYRRDVSTKLMQIAHWIATGR